MNFEEYLDEAKALTKIPGWPAQWAKGTIQTQPFTITDEEGSANATAYIAQTRKKAGTWFVIAKSFDMGMEDLTKGFDKEADAKKVFKKLTGDVSWSNMHKLLK